MYLLKEKNNNDIYGFIHKYPNLNVSATCSSTRDPLSDRNFQCDAPIKVDSTDIWYSKNEDETHTYTVSFNDFSIYLTSYSIQVSTDPAFPKQWTLDGIDANNQITRLSEIDDSNLNEAMAIGVFPNNNSKGPYKQFKFTSTGLNYLSSSNSGYNTYKYCFYLYKIDFFGYANILSNMHSWNVCPRHNQWILSYILVLYP